MAQGTSDAVVDLQDLGFERCELAGEILIVGAMTRLTDLKRFVSKAAAGQGAFGPEGPDQLLVESIHRAGPNTYRNAATAGGEIASLLPDSEFLSALLVLNAQLTLREKEERSLSVVDYLDTVEDQGGLILEVKIPLKRGRAASERVARTPADYPIVSVTAFKPELGEIRLAATGIDDGPVRLRDAEELYNAGANIEKVASVVRSRAIHAGDFRGDANYRAEMGYVLAKRVLRRLA